MARSPELPAARVLAVDLDRIEPCESGARPRPWSTDDSELARLAAWGGSALAVALLVEEARRDPGASAVPLVLSVGCAVRRGVPTAARLSVASRGALTGRFAEGQVGGDAARRLARFADALVLRGRTELAGAVLEIGARGEPRLHGMAELVGLDSESKRRALRERFGDVAALSIGPGGERGVRFATLISGLDRASHVGRGGLGAVFGGLGLAALVFREPESAARDEPEQSVEPILSALSRSPRLRVRAEGGTHELWPAFQARGELRGRNSTWELSREQARTLWEETRAAATDHHGCKGCPTPCGWEFDRGQRGRPVGPRFGAALALGPNLGLSRLDPTLDLFAVCDEAGIDAKETGAVLALRMRARELGRCDSGPEWGDAEAAREAIAELLAHPDSAAGGALGAAALARELGLEHEVRVVKNQAARPDRDLASLLGQCVSSNGADPMRSFPFATADGLDRARMEALLSGVRLPAGAEDGRDPRGKGRLVWWHESLVAALDASGFCSFSAGGLLSDGVADLDRLAEWVAPEAGTGGRDGAVLLEVGASVVGHRRELAARWGAEPEEDRPAWASAELDAPGMLDEYRLARGLDPAGRPLEEAVRALRRGRLFAWGREALARVDAARGPEPAARATEASPASSGTVRLRGTGPLAAKLGGEVELELELPATVDRVVGLLARARPAAASSLFADGRLTAAAYRDGSRVGATDFVDSGDVLDLVVAVSGG